MGGKNKEVGIDIPKTGDNKTVQYEGPRKFIRAPFSINGSSQMNYCIGPNYEELKSSVHGIEITVHKNPTNPSPDAWPVCKVEYKSGSATKSARKR